MDRPTDRVLLTIVWLSAAAAFLRFWDLTVEIEAVLLWTFVFTALYAGATGLLHYRRTPSARYPWGPVLLWLVLAAVGTTIGLVFPFVVLGGTAVQTVAFL